MWHEWEHVSGSCSSIQNGRFESQFSMTGKTSSITQLKKLMEENRSMRRNRSDWKMVNKHIFVFLQDSSKSLENKCVYTRLDVFTWINFASNTPGIIKNQSWQYFQKIWTCVSNFWNSSKDSKIKSKYSHLHACIRSKTRIQKNTSGLILRKRENGWVRFHLIQFDGVNAMFFHSRAITHVILKKNRHCMKSTASYGMAG